MEKEKEQNIQLFDLAHNKQLKPTTRIHPAMLISLCKISQGQNGGPRLYCAVSGRYEIKFLIKRLKGIFN